MSYVVTLEGFTPSRRYDGQPWTTAKIEEAAAQTGPWTLIDTITLSPVDADPKRPATRNLTTANALLQGGWYRVTLVDASANTQTAEPVGVAVGLVTLQRVKAALDIDFNDTTHDEAISDAVRDASAAILHYTDRDFGAPSVDEEREYPYDPSGIVDIDDAVDVTAVTIIAPGGFSYDLRDEEWYAEPVTRPLGVYEWLTLPRGIASTAPSPAMGFLWNADRYPSGSVDPTLVSVTATFGWPIVPDDVQRAAILTAGSFYSKIDEGLAAESIEGYSRSWFNPQAAFGREEAIPQKAKDLLAPYTRIPI